MTRTTRRLSRARARSRWVALLAAAACAFLVASPASGQEPDPSGTYEGDFDNGGGFGAGMIEIEVTCDGGTCTFEHPSSSWVTVWRKGIGQATVIEVPAAGGTVTIDMGIDDTCTPGVPWPDATIDVEFAGDTMTFDSDVPVSVHGQCSALPNGAQESFTGTLVGSGDDAKAEGTNDAAQGTSTTAVSRPTDADADDGADPEGEEESSVAPIAGGAVALAAVAGGGALLVRRRRNRPVAPTAQAAGSAKPQVRPKGDSGSQSILPSAPSTALSIRAIPGPTPRSTITRAGNGSDDNRIEQT